MDYSVREATSRDAVKIATLMRESMQNGYDGRLKLSSARLLARVQRIIGTPSGFSYVLTADGEIVGAFLAELVQHEFADGYIAKEVGVFIKPEHRGHQRFVKLLLEFLKWKDTKPDVLFTTFSIGQLGPTTPYLRHVLKAHGFTQGDEGYYLQ